MSAVCSGFSVSWIVFVVHGLCCFLLSRINVFTSTVCSSYSVTMDCVGCPVVTLFVHGLCCFSSQESMSLHLLSSAVTL